MPCVYAQTMAEIILVDPSPISLADPDAITLAGPNAITFGDLTRIT